MSQYGPMRSLFIALALIVGLATTSHAQVFKPRGKAALKKVDLHVAAGAATPVVAASPAPATPVVHKAAARTPTHASDDAEPVVKKKKPVVAKKKKKKGGDDDDVQVTDDQDDDVKVSDD